MNIFKRLYSFFKKPQDKSETDDSIGSITFEINKDGTINIICNWPDFNENNVDEISGIARYYALSILAINSGFLEKDTIDTIKNYNSDNPYENLFAHNVLAELIHIEKNKRDNDPTLKKPIISPLEAFSTKN